MSETKQLIEVGSAPVRPENLVKGGNPPEPGLAICLSGGGYRAMLFHLGALWRLNDGGILSSAKRISSVSGGSITAAVLGLRWSAAVRAEGRPANAVFAAQVAGPILKLAQRTVDVRSVGTGLFSRGSISEKVQRHYDELLFRGATLQDLPDAPRFTINATNIATGTLWRFQKPYMADYQVGLVPNPKVPLALAVAASSAFPPVLSPTTLHVDVGQYETNDTIATYTSRAYRERIELTDGGVYDNLGLETAWKNYTEVLVCDAGAAFKPEPKPAADWLSGTRRTLDLIDRQVRALRRKQIGNSLALGYAAEEGAPNEFARLGEYWSIVDPLKAGDSDFEATPERTKALAQTPTRLAALKLSYCHRLVNWGYASTDAALRRRYRPQLERVSTLPLSGGI